MDFSTEEDGADHFSQFSSPEVLRPHLAQAMKFTKTLQSAVEKAALRAQKIREQLAAVRKASVLPGSPQQLGQGQGGRRGTNMSFIGQKSRSPSIAVGGRRTSSRPSLSAGAGSVGGIGSIGGVGAGGFGSPSRHGTLLRKSSSAGATGMNGTGGAGGGEAADGSAQTRRESTVRKNSTSPGLQARTNGTGRNTGGSLLLQKGSSFGISSTPTSPTFSPAGSPVRSDSMGNLSGFGGHTGKFKPSFHARSDSKLGGRSAHHTILEEDSGSVIGGVGSPTEDGVKSSPGSGKRGKSLQGSRQSSPSKLGASSPAKRSTGADSIAIKAGPVGAAGAGGAATAAASKPVSRAGSRLSVSSKGSSATTTAATAYAGSKTDGAATAENITSGAGGGSGTPAKIPGERNSRSNNRKSSSAAAAPLLARNSSTSGLKLPPPINTDLASSKSMRFTVTAPTLTEGSESSDHTGSPAKPKKGRKKSTVRASSLAEMSVDNTTVSLALASPPRVSSPGAGNKNNNTSTGGGHVKKKRGTILAGEKGLQNNQPRISSIVTRLPPVQGDVRLTRRKGE